MSGIGVFENATAHNFRAQAYLLANDDLRKAFGEDQVLAERHFYEYGIHENRRQLSQAFQQGLCQKFNLFKDSLPECAADRFPVSFGENFHSTSEYIAESANGYPGFWIKELEENPNNLYADIGAGLRSEVWLNCANVEVYPSLTTDILIEPNNKLPFRDASIDGVGCFAVLEHVSQPWEMAREFARVVKPGGKIFIDWPFLQPVHGFPSHYYNATREGLRSLFSEHFRIDDLYTGVWQGPDSTIWWVLNAFLYNLDEIARSKISEMTIAELSRQSPQSQFWLELLGKLDDAAISMLSCGNTLIGTRT